jgi:putative iron-dependent peroxidase
MAKPQIGIVRKSRPYSTFLVLSINNSPSAIEAVRKLCWSVTKMSAGVNKADKGADLAFVLSFGDAFWKTLSPTAPKRLGPFNGISGTTQEVPATGGDIFIHINSKKPGANFALASEAMAILKGHAIVMDEAQCFVYQDSRDLTGFIDGTANPKGRAATIAALVDDDAKFNDGSFVLTQRYVHNLEKWGTVPAQEQERIIGRTKKKSVELDPKPEDSHIARAEIMEGGKERKIVRHSMPYGSAKGVQGLFFVAYAKDPAIFETQLARMFGGAPDGMRDRLMEFSRPVTGAFFFAPSMTGLANLARS